MKYLLLFVSTILFISCNEVPDELIIPLSNEVGHGPFSQRSFLPEPLKKDSLKIEGAPTDLTKFSLRKIDFQPLYADKIKQDIIFCVGERNDSIIVIVDANNNCTFVDDKEFVFKKHLKEDEKLSIREILPVVNTNFQYIEGNDTLNVKLALQINPYTRISITQRVGDQIIDIFENEVKVALTIHDFKTAQFKLAGQEYKVAFNSDTRPIFNGPRCHPELIIEKKENEYIPTGEGYVSTKPGEDILIDNLLYKFDTVSKFGDIIKLIFKDRLEVPIGVNIGQYPPDFKKSTVDSKLFQLSSFKGDYVLIDFWGTWCNPCIESIPDLKQIYEDYNNKGLVMVSVAFDNNYDAVIKSIEHHGLTWYNIFQNQKDKSDYALTKLLKINAFPTLILIDPEGKIIERDTGSDKLDIIRNILNQNL